METLKEFMEEHAGIKELESFNKFMFVGPHPDDIEIGCGGLISKLSGLGKEIRFVLVTEGGAGIDTDKMDIKEKIEIRHKESSETAHLLGATSIDFLDFEDGGTQNYIDVTRKLAPLVMEYSPDIIFVTDPFLDTEIHFDHIVSGNAVRNTVQVIKHKGAMKRQGIEKIDYDHYPTNIAICYYFTDKPNVYVKLDDENHKRKFEAINLHKSQNSGFIFDRFSKYFELKMIDDGIKCGAKYAESYRLVMPFNMHCVVKFE